ncbi:hypothetical protein R3X28_11785 [Maribacter sp. TH_r10]|uniref:hypothetical protein n=1 Tax=Maribacter sp. TH_r10 TaxID=3082086 RepID=UPI0029549E41|nr:hypothetical protein [Maribacter sp. TH_r10]MDV7139564.1 hypothetical protein [Maribacter sp. TH_r10]
MKNPLSHSTKVLVSMAFLLSTMALFLSCKQAAEKTQEKLIEKSIGKDADVDLDDEKIVIKTDEGTFTTDATAQNWPNDIPSHVPEFTSGKIEVVNTQEMIGGKSWTILFEDVNQDNIKAYKDNLEEKDFTIKFTTIAGSGIHFAAEKENVSVMVLGDEKGASITVSIKE